MTTRKQDQVESTREKPKSHREKVAEALTLIEEKYSTEIKVEVDNILLQTGVYYPKQEYIPQGLSELSAPLVKLTKTVKASDIIASATDKQKEKLSSIDTTLTAFKAFKSHDNPKLVKDIVIRYIKSALV